MTPTKTTFLPRAAAPRRNQNQNPNPNNHRLQPPCVRVASSYQHRCLVSARMGNNPSSTRNDSSRRDRNKPPAALSEPAQTPLPFDDSATSAANTQWQLTNDALAAHYEDVILQGFHWTSCKFNERAGRSWYDEVRSKISVIQATGVKVMWLPPPSHSVSPEGYLPQRLYGGDKRIFVAIIRLFTRLLCQILVIL